MPCYDLHSHTYYSDGEMSPLELVTTAVQAGTTHLAITDHDNFDAYLSLQNEDLPEGFTLIPGAEFSTHWFGYEIHVLGLWLDPENDTLKQGVAAQKERRQIRAENIDIKLSELGIIGALADLKIQYPYSLLTRAHFAKWLLDKNYCTHFQQAFDKYLGQDKPAYTGITWPEIEEVINWIHAAGGKAVLAHPLRYPLKTKRIRELIKYFKKVGGDGIEVVTASINLQQMQMLATICDTLDLKASCGADFHGKHMPWIKMGNLLELPKKCKPIWEE